MNTHTFTESNTIHHRAQIQMHVMLQNNRVLPLYSRCIIVSIRCLIVRFFVVAVAAVWYFSSSCKRIFFLPFDLLLFLLLDPSMKHKTEDKQRKNATDSYKIEWIIELDAIENCKDIHIFTIMFAILSSSFDLSYSAQLYLCWLSTRAANWIKIYTSLQIAFK